MKLGYSSSDNSAFAKVHMGTPNVLATTGLQYLSLSEVVLWLSHMANGRNLPPRSKLQLLAKDINLNGIFT